MGEAPPLAPKEDYSSPAERQAFKLSTRRGGSPRQRKCLLKGCEKWFRPDKAQERYCSDSCVDSARVWSVRKARREYRASERGKEKRREQSRRRRQRQEESRSVSAVLARVITGDCRDSFLWWCDRPGCYERFCHTRRSPLQRFCARSCRRAVERVVEREKKWKKRS